MSVAFVDQITLLVKEGYTDAEAMNMPLDKVSLCTESILRRKMQERTVMVVDTASAIGGLFSKDGVKKHLETLKE